MKIGKPKALMKRSYFEPSTLEVVEEKFINEKWIEVDRFYAPDMWWRYRP